MMPYQQCRWYVRLGSLLLSDSTPLRRLLIWHVPPFSPADVLHSGIDLSTYWRSRWYPWASMDDCVPGSVGTRVKGQNFLSSLITVRMKLGQLTPWDSFFGYSSFPISPPQP
jgi:hypothetical protein